MAIAAQLQRIGEERDRHGGWEAWESSLEPFRASVRQRRQAIDSAEPIVRGLDDFLFWTYTLDYLVYPDLVDQPIPRGSQGQDPLQLIIATDRYLKTLGVDLVFVPVPVKLEVYPDMLFEDAPPGIVAPQLLEFETALLKSDVEVLDLIIPFTEERHRMQDLIYRKDDPHWSSRGIELAAGRIAERLERYRFESDSASTFSTTVTMRGNRGAQFPKLAETDQAAYPPLEFPMIEVLRDGQPYQDPENSQVLVIGDSFVMAMGESGRLGAQLAAQLGIDVQSISEPGGGPLVPRRLARLDRATLMQRRVVVWVMVNNYLSYWSRWPAEEFEAAATRSTPKG